MTEQPKPIENPWDSAENPVEIVFSNDYYGQAAVDTFFCVLQKTIGRVPFNPAEHKPTDRRTAIDIAIATLPEQNLQFEVFRNLIAESKEWAGIVLPSIRNLGITLRELNGKWVHAHTKQTGETYVNKNGETKNKTTLEFLELYPDEATCRAAFLASGNTPAPAASTPANSPEKETALKFLKVIVENAARGQTSLDVIRQTIAVNLSTMPMVGKHFTVDSPEVLPLIQAAMGK